MKFYVIMLLFLSIDLCASESSSSHKWKAELSSGLFSMQVKKKASTNSPASSTSFTQLELRPSISYFLTPQFSLSAVYFQTTLVEDFSTTGLGVSGRWYFKRGTMEAINLADQKIDITPVWTYFVSLGAKEQRLEGETVTVKFTGFEIGGGFQRALKNRYYIGGDIYVASLVSGSTRTALSQSFLLSFGRFL